MKKIHSDPEVITAQFYHVDLSQLKLIVARAETALKERVNPGEQVLIDVAPNLYFIIDPQMLRGDLERRTYLDKPRDIIAESLSPTSRVEQA